ncbi:hypothetical protein [Cystobacter fuscus]|uniref:hypothetical protein n=1 Tax=Cystobacter fuscus TaxID=43 RepID=UPI002B2FB0DF|nr:hypothetical protein F0U63_21410 [Cystobacter fuscus]
MNEKKALEMTPDVSLSEIFARCLEKYGSLSSPSFLFVRQAADQAPYAALLERLKEWFEILDDTDLNDDVCFFYVLRRNGKVWSLLLSMVGPYGLFMRADEPRCVVLTSASSDLPDIERTTMDVVRSEGVQLLGSHTLEQPIALNLWPTEPDGVCLFQALFTDSSVFPWRGLEF